MHADSKGYELPLISENQMAWGKRVLVPLSLAAILAGTTGGIKMYDAHEQARRRAEHKESMRQNAAIFDEMLQLNAKMVTAQALLQSALEEEAEREFDPGMYDVFKDLYGEYTKLGFWRSRGLSRTPFGESFALNRDLFRIYVPNSGSLPEEEIAARIMAFSLAETVVAQKYTADGIANLEDWKAPYLKMGIAESPQERHPLSLPPDTLWEFFKNG